MSKMIINFFLVFSLFFGMTSVVLAGNYDLSYKSEISYINKTKNFEFKTESHIWTSGSKIKVATRVGENSLVTISDGQNVYLLDTLRKIAYHQGLNREHPPSSPLKTAVDYNEKIKNKLLKKTGTETISGQPCQIYLITDKTSGTREKIWFWEEKKFPLKIETENPQEKMTISNTDLSFDKILDQTIFKVPAGYQIKEIPKNEKN